MNRIETAYQKCKTSWKPNKYIKHKKLKRRVICAKVFFSTIKQHYLVLACQEVTRQEKIENTKNWMQMIA